MKNKLWFKRKTYGYGWYPITIEGWLVTIIFIIFNIANALRTEASNYTETLSVLNIIIPMVISLIILIAICIKKGEKPRWQWGNSKR